MKLLIDDFIKEIRKYFENLIADKEKKLNIIEGMIKECELYKYDNTLIENIKNLNLENNKNIIYNQKGTWIRKLSDILEYYNEPIKIKKTKLCLEKNLKGPYVTLKQVKINEKNGKNIENTEIITDICPLFYYKEKNYYAVSYNNGLLKIYDDDFKKRVPFKIIKEFEEKEGINSLFKSSKKILILVGYSKIKKIKFSDNLEDYQIITEFELENQLLKTLIELESFDILIATDNHNQLLAFNSKTGNLISDITNTIYEEKEKEIIYLDKLSENKIIIMLNEFKSMNINLEKNTINLTMTILDEENNNKNNNYNVNNETSMSNSQIYKQNESRCSFWKILEIDFESNQIKVKKNYILEKNINYLGKLNDQLILLFNKDLNQIIIFDLINYYKILELPFNTFQKPIISFTLNKRNNLMDIFFLCEEGNLIQYALNLSIGLLYPDGKAKIDNLTDKSFNYYNLYDEKLNTNNIAIKNNVVKIIQLESKNFLLITDENFIYNLKHNN